MTICMTWSQLVTELAQRGWTKIEGRDIDGMTGGNVQILRADAESAMPIEIGEEEGRLVIRKVAT